MESEIRLKDPGLAPHVALLAVQIMFGTWPIVGKVVLRAISITGPVALRVIGAAICLITLQGRLKELRAIPRVDLAWLGVCSLLGVILNQLLFVKGLSLTTVINSTLLSTTIPVFTLAVSIALGYDRLSLRRTVGILLAAGGVVHEPAHRVHHEIGGMPEGLEPYLHLGIGMVLQRPLQKLDDGPGDGEEVGERVGGQPDHLGIDGRQLGQVRERLVQSLLGLLDRGGRLGLGVGHAYLRRESTMDAGRLTRRPGSS